MFCIKNKICIYILYCRHEHLKSTEKQETRLHLLSSSDIQITTRVQLADDRCRCMTIDVTFAPSIVHAF